MTAPVRVRPASRRDIQRSARTFADLPLFTAYGLGSEQLEERWLSGRGQGDGLLVALSDDELVGVCWFLPSGTFATGAYLRTLAVVPAAQSQGIGARLLEEFERATAGAPGGWFLLASDDNEGAHRFYQRHGYREVGRIPDFAKKGLSERIFFKANPAPGHR